MESANQVPGTTSARCPSPKAPSPKKAVIAIMGATGSGKSSLIAAITGQDNIIGYGLQSETMSVTPYKITVESTEMVLVDTPGFDDSSMPECQVLQAIASWLEQTFEVGSRLNGLVYLHPINVKRMEGSARRALHLFQRICGEENYRNVLLATTFWNKIEHCKEEGIERERHLLETEGFWKSMKESGARTQRLSKDYREIIPVLLSMATQPKMTLDLQSQLNDGIPLDQTMAGLFIKDEEKEIVEHHEAKTLRSKEQFETNLEEYKARNAAARATQHRASAAESEALIASAKKKTELLQHQLELFKLNQKIKEAELAAKRRDDEAEARQFQQEQEAELERTHERAAESEAKHRFQLSLDQMKKIEQQMEILCAVRQAGIFCISIPEMPLDSAQVSRSGINNWCDFCLKPFGLGQSIQCSECVPELFDLGYVFAICSECFNDGRRCFNQKHRLELKSNYEQSEDSSRKICNRLLNPFGVQCDVTDCMETIEGIYFHCCICNNDDFDICIHCAAKGYRCHDIGHNLAWGVQPERSPYVG